MHPAHLCGVYSVCCLWSGSPVHATVKHSCSYCKTLLFFNVFNHGLWSVCCEILNNGYRKQTNFRTELGVLFMMNVLNTSVCSKCLCSFMLSSHYGAARWYIRILDRNAFFVSVVMSVFFLSV